MWGVDLWGGFDWAVHSVPWGGVGFVALLAVGLAFAGRAALRACRLSAGTLAIVRATLPLVAYGATLTLPHVFVNGTLADTDEVNAHFDAIVDALTPSENLCALFRNEAVAWRANTATFTSTPVSGSPNNLVETEGNCGVLTTTHADAFDAATVIDLVASARSSGPCRRSRCTPGRRRPAGGSSGPSSARRAASPVRTATSASRRRPRCRCGTTTPARGAV